MTSKHTPGPWALYSEDTDPERAKKALCDLVDGTPDFRPRLYMVVASNGLAAAVTGCGRDSLGNARLIAEAPAMLDALRKIDNPTIPTDKLQDGLSREVRAILAKIDGGAE